MDTQDLNYYWKTVVDTIQDGVMIVNPEGTIISVNRAFEEITGYGKAEIVGRSCTVLELQHLRGGPIEPARMPLVRDVRAGAFEKTAVHGGPKKDGRAVHVVKNASVLRDHEGNVTGAVETMADITDLMDKETQIASYRQELDAEDRFYGMIGVSAPMQRVFELVANAAQSDAPVIVFGESGTAKELVARAIHRGRHPPQAGRPM